MFAIAGVMASKKPSATLSIAGIPSRMKWSMINLLTSLFKLVLVNRQTNHWITNPVVRVIPSPPLFLTTTFITLTASWCVWASISQNNLIKANTLFIVE